MNIRKSMFIKISLMIVVPFLLFSLFILQVYKMKLKSVIEDSLQAVATAQRIVITGFCEQQMNSLQLIGDSEVSKAALRNELDEEMLEYLDNVLLSSVQTADYLESTTLINSDYRVVACSEEEPVIEADRGIVSLIEAMGDKAFYISDVLQSTATDHPYEVVVAITKIQDRGEPAGYILAEINLDFYSSIREQAGFWENSTFYLLDGKNQIISAGTPEDDRSFFVTTEEERKDYQEKYRAIDREKNPCGSFTYKVSGRDYVTYYSNVEYTDWEMLLTVSMNNYMVQSIIYGLILVSLVLICVITAVWLGLFTSKRIIRPVNNISNTLNQIQETQDYSLRIARERDDELGMVVKEINKLIYFVEMENLQRMQHHNLLQRRADRDALTKVLNKERINQYIQEMIGKHQEKKSKAALIFVDIDDFKAFNTNYGHSVGDQVLLFLASLLGRETQGTVGRVGGDEFVVIVDESEILASLEECLDRIERAAQERFFLRNSGIGVPVSCCMGVVCVDFAKPYGEKVTVKCWMNQADAAMYDVKNSGKHGHIVREYKVEE